MIRAEVAVSSRKHAELARDQSEARALLHASATLVFLLLCMEAVGRESGDIGSPGNDDGGSGAGLVCVYKWDGRSVLPSVPCFVGCLRSVRVVCGFRCSCSRVREIHRRSPWARCTRVGA